MASITLRDLDDDVKARLRVRAARHGRSMEEEARVILRSALAEPEKAEAPLGDAISRRFQALGGVELELPPRQSRRRLPAFR